MDNKFSKIIKKVKSDYQKEFNIQTGTSDIGIAVVMV